MITVAWDVDDVLNELMRRWFELVWSPGHAEARVAYDDLSGNPPDEVLGLSRTEYLTSLDAFRHDPRCVAQAPRRDVLDWFGREGEGARHVALTAVPLHAADVSAAWVVRTYGRWIRCFGLAPSPRPDDPPPAITGKGDWLDWFGGVDLFVDDSEDNVAEAQERGVRALLFPQPWNAAAGRPVEDLLNEVAAAVRAGRGGAREKTS
jgi:hypothetical protein